MSWTSEALEDLSRRPCCGYEPAGAPAAEPTALASMALGLHGRQAPAHEAMTWLASIQSADGSLGINAANKTPCWATGWAVLAWRTAMPGGSLFSAAADRAVEWLLTHRARPQPRTPILGHDTQLQAWPWVEGTHSWIEPTAINLMALRASGQAAHPRTREAVAMLCDRMLPSGGWNYGNKVVLGNTLRPHLQPTGLALAALAGEPTAAEASRRSLDYLEATLLNDTPTASLCFGLIGLAAHGRRPPAAEAWLEAAFRRTKARDASPYKIALTLLAAEEHPCPWLVLKENR